MQTKGGLLQLKMYKQGGALQGVASHSKSGRHHCSSCMDWCIVLSGLPGRRTSRPGGCWRSWAMRSAKRCRLAPRVLASSEPPSSSPLVRGRFRTTFMSLSSTELKKLAGWGATAARGPPLPSPRKWLDGPLLASRSGGVQALRWCTARQSSTLGRPVNRRKVAEELDANWQRPPLNVEAPGPSPLPRWRTRCIRIRCHSQFVHTCGI